MYSKDILKMVLEKFHEISFTNKKAACRRQAMQRDELKIKEAYNLTFEYQD